MSNPPMPNINGEIAVFLSKGDIEFVPARLRQHLEKDASPQLRRLLIDDPELVGKILAFNDMEANRELLRVFSADARSRTQPATHETIKNAKAILLSASYEFRSEGAAALRAVSNNPAVYPSVPFVTDEDFMRAFAGNCRTSEASHPLNSMIYRAVREECVERHNPDMLAAIGRSVHAALKAAFKNDAQTRTGGMAQNLLRVLHHFPGVSLRREVFADMTLPASSFHGIDQMEVTTALIPQILIENKGRMTDELLAGLRDKAPKGGSMIGEEEIAYLTAVTEATDADTASTILTPSNLQTFDAGTLILLAMRLENRDGYRDFADMLRTNFAVLPKIAQIDGLLAVAYRDENLFGHHGVWSGFLKVAADNTTPLQGGLENWRYASMLEHVGLKMTSWQPPAHPANRNAASAAYDLLFKQIEPKAVIDFIKRRKGTDHGDAFRSFGANKRAIPTVGENLGIFAPVRHAWHRFAARFEPAGTSKA